MKKLLLSALMAVALFAAQAQEKVTKTNIVGNWEIKALKLEDKVYYDFEKDSVSLGKEILDQLQAAGQDAAGASEMMKGSFAALKDMAFAFNADGSYIVSGNPDGKTGKGKYTLDEAKDHLTMTSEKEDKEVKEADVAMAKNRLMLTVDTGMQGKITFILAKAAK